MMRAREDHVCFHEPFGRPWYFGEEPMWPRAGKDGERIPGLTFQSVWNELKAAADRGPVFSKDFPHYTRHLWSEDFLDHFRHSFLIRDPARVIHSLYRKWPDLVMDEVGILEQRELFDRLCDATGTAPPVIDSDDLLENPLEVVQAYCDAVDIPFVKEALSWPPGEREEVSWYDRGSWHENLRNSDGLKPQKTVHADPDSLPERIRAMYEACLPHYRHMYRYRLVPDRCGETIPNP